MADGGISLSVLAERLDAVKAGIDLIRADLKLVSDQALDRRVSQLEDTVRWLTRSLAGMVFAVIVAVVVAVVTR